MNRAIALGLIILSLLGALGMGVSRLHSRWFEQGRTAEREETAERIREARHVRQADAQKTLARAQLTGRQHEATRSALDRLFDQLEQEASHAASTSTTAATSATTATFDLDCAGELPDARLRIWQAANAGLGARLEDSAPSEPGASPSGATTGLKWPLGGFGIQPPRGGQALPPAGQPALPAIGFSGDAPSSVQPVAGDNSTN